MHLVESVVVGSGPVLELDSAVKLGLLPGLAVAGGLVASWQSELAAAYFAFAADSTHSVVHGLVPLEPEHLLAVGVALLLAELASSADAESVSLISKQTPTDQNLDYTIGENSSPVAGPAAAAGCAQLVVAAAEDVAGD